MDFSSIRMLVGGLAAGCAVGFGVKKVSDGGKLKSADAQAQALLAKAKEQASLSDNQARNRARNIEQAAQTAAEKDARKREQDARDQERRVREKETQLEQ